MEEIKKGAKRFFSKKKGVNKKGDEDFFQKMRGAKEILTGPNKVTLSTERPTTPRSWCVIRGNYVLLLE